jgi:putative ribosome biogenesis GTPase RsgA
MVIKVDVSRLSDSLKEIIVSIFEQKSILQRQSNINKNILVLVNENDVQSIKQILEDTLNRNLINDYLVAENSKEQNEIAILKRGDIEQLGIFICDHCGMLFDSELQRTIHQRIHYFF